MNAKELRINNWVNHSNSAIWIDEVKNTPIRVDIDVLSNIQYYEPIPLSPSILEKCGFVVFENKSNIDGVECRLEIDHKTMFTSCGKINGGLVVMGLCGGNYFMKNIEFLHDLQNVYYSITQTELNIKL